MASFSTKWLKVSEPFPHVFHVELSRESVNAFSPEYRREYGRLFDVLTEAHASETDARVVVLSLAFPKIFSAGPDYAVHGPVVGLAVDLIVACEVRYAASNTSYSIKEVNIGLAPEVGTLAHLPQITLTFRGYAVEAGMKLSSRPGWIWRKRLWRRQEGAAGRAPRNAPPPPAQERKEERRDDSGPGKKPAPSPSRTCISRGTGTGSRASRPRAPVVRRTEVVWLGTLDEFSAERPREQEGEGEEEAG
ncbi:putative enoyl-CoA hydratase/isomerase [Lyophyllum shimeji]|uniref:Enoyl-CoA hydratase/isomerase n=1 Tax=Lyophyllum shimeji TaxID=47721 RepID=A0A9P3Q1T9_LYOSH|nr:putative enoyl-CoA hydratase/isomerase [Lyophyllum shimeji]